MVRPYRRRILYLPPRRRPYASRRTQSQNSHRPAQPGRVTSGRERILAAQAGDDVRHSQEPCRKRSGDSRRGHAGDPARRLRLPAQPAIELPARTRRHLRQPASGAPVQPAHRRQRRGADQGAQGWRTLLRHVQDQHHQLRAAGSGAPPHQLRQSDAALPARAAQDGDGKPADAAKGRAEGQHAPGHRPHLADRQRPARPDRGAAADRQDGHAAKHRHLDLQQSIRKSSSSCCSSTSGPKR